MAKLGAVLDGWMKQANVTISAVQCWTSFEEFFGVVPCTIMSMMSDNLIPSACETDVPGTLSMYMLALARARLRRCWTGTTTTAAIPTSASASTAPTCPSTSSKM
jgi:spore coat polysaccharide biosynthesis predicted glycosyltransferase SpsG